MKKIQLLPLLFFFACTTTKQTIITTTQPAQSIVVDGKLFTAIYQQKAAEYKALCFQAYNLAHLRLDQVLQTRGLKPKAIITDIDETVLDNSPYAISQAVRGKDYEPETWYQWTGRAAADTVPGAPTFLKYAAANGVEVFYITNRDEKERAATMQNLRKYNLPNSDTVHLIMRQTISSKEERRQQVLRNYDVVMLIGDNLADFSSLFDKRQQAERETNTLQTADAFGKRFIVLPNPNYGDWESALYNYGRYTTAQKDSILRISGKGY